MATTPPMPTMERMMHMVEKQARLLTNQHAVVAPGIEQFAAAQALQLAALALGRIAMHLESTRTERE